MRIQDVATFAVALSLATHLTAQASWTQVATTGPAARFLHAMAYDSQRERTVLFGGRDLGNISLGDTWEWSGTAWTQVATTGPSASTSHAMAYDSARGRTVLFGGSNIGDTWEWNGSTWSQVAITGPGVRRSHAMAYDSVRGKTVLFGGSDGYGPLGDTWEWNGSTWSQASTTGPSARVAHAMAYDNVRGKTVLFGGLLNAFSIFGDTWEWNGSTWTQVATTGPAGIWGPVMVYDSQRAKTVLFGGTVGPNALGETWEWDGTQWTQVSTSGPQAHHYHAMAYDSQRGKTVLFGGYGGSALGDTWEWGIPFSSATSFGAGCGNPSLMMSPVANARPTINTTAQAALTNIPSSLAFVAIGWSRTTVGPFALPFPLVGYGMIGCYMLQSAEAAAQPVTFTGIGSATYSLPLPNWSGLIGLHVYLQGWASAPGANAGNTIVSNGVDWLIGY